MIFIWIFLLAVADMEDLSNRVETCSLYEEMQAINLPVHVRAFGEYALVIPPQELIADVPKVDLESQCAPQVFYWSIYQPSTYFFIHHSLISHIVLG